MADETTTYTVTGTDIYGCHDSDQVTITVLTHDADKAGSLQRICEGGSVNLYAEGGVTYEWFPAATLNDAHSATPTATPTATTDYYVSIMQNRCFTDTLHQKVEVWQIPTIKLDPDFKAIPGAEVPLNTQTGNGATKITWSPADGLSCTDCFRPTATFTGTTTYTATVTNDIGCSAQDDMTITVACDEAAFYMANTFTPNGDGQHDWFYPQGKGVNKVSRFMIYNRWGETVFSATDIPVNDPTRGWDGSFRNQPLAPDVFVYIIEAICADGTPVQVKGDIALMR
jgi:gliding motility-associated-like protein